MALWKTMLVVGVVVLAWFFAHGYFDLVALIAGGLWVTEYFRSKAHGGGASRATSIEPLARRLGIPVRSNQRTVKFRWNGVLMHLSAREESTGVRTHTVWTLSSPTFRRVPFCFVLRPRKATIKEADLVENSRIDGIKFEYQLKRTDVPTPLEAAANLPDLFAEVLDQGNGSALLEWGRDAGTVQKLYFNGRVIHADVLLDLEGSQQHLAAMLDAHVAFHLNLLDLIDDVNFKVPM